MKVIVRGAVGIRDRQVIVRAVDYAAQSDVDASRNIDHNMADAQALHTFLMESLPYGTWAKLHKLMDEALT